MRNNPKFLFILMPKCTKKRPKKRSGPRWVKSGPAGWSQLTIYKL